MNLGKVIRFLRGMKDMTQQELADAVGVNVSYINLLENDHKNPSFSTVHKLCKAMGVSLMWVAFLMDTDHPDVQPYIPEVVRNLMRSMQEEPSGN